MMCPLVPMYISIYFPRIYNTKMIVTFIYSFIITFIPSLLLFLSSLPYVLELFYYLFVSKSHGCIYLVCSEFLLFIDVFPDLINLFKYFLLMIIDLMILLHNRTRFLLLISRYICLNRKK